MANFFIFLLFLPLIRAENITECQSIVVVYSGTFQYSDNQTDKFNAYIEFKLDANLIDRQVILEIKNLTTSDKNGYGFGISNSEYTSFCNTDYAPKCSIEMSNKKYLELWFWKNNGTYLPRPIFNANFTNKFILEDSDGECADKLKYNTPISDQTKYNQSYCCVEYAPNLKCPDLF